MTIDGSFPVAASYALNVPLWQDSIVGTRLSDQIGNLSNRMDMLKKLGLTHFYTNWNANDHGQGLSLATMENNMQSLLGSIASIGLAATWSTTTPSSSATALAISSLTSTQGSNTVTATCASTAAMTTGRYWQINGATQTEYNVGLAKVTVVNSTTFTYQTTTATTVATATTTTAFSTFPAGYSSNAYKSLALQAPQVGNYTGGSSSVWAQVNAYIRSAAGGLLYDCVDLADAVTPTRDDCRWVAGGAYGGTNHRLWSQFGGTVASVVNSQRITINGLPSGYSVASTQDGYVVFTSGAAAGAAYFVSSLYGAQLIFGSAMTTLPAVNDNFDFIPYGKAQGATDTDGLHPSQGIGNTGGFYLLEDAFQAKLATWKAAA